MEAALRQGSVIAMLVMGVLAPVTSLHADVQCSKLASAPEVDFAAAARIDTAIDGWFETPWAIWRIFGPDLSRGCGDHDDECGANRPSQFVAARDLAKVPSVGCVG